MEKCFVVHSMSALLQREYWRSTGEAFRIGTRGLHFTEHKMSEFGNCQRCGWHAAPPPSEKKEK
jgi:hypothetical protein